MSGGTGSGLRAALSSVTEVACQRLREAGFEARRLLEEGIKEALKRYHLMSRASLRNA